MKLNVFERVSLLQILPKEGDFTTLKILRDLQGIVGFSEEDHKKFEIKRVDNQITWNPEEGTKEVEIEFGEKAKEIVKEALLDLDKSKKLRPELFTLYEKFVQEKKEEKSE